MKIIQIAVQAAEDGEIFGLDDDGKMYVYRHAHPVGRDFNHSPLRDGCTGGWEPMKGGLNQIIYAPLTPEIVR